MKQILIFILFSAILCWLMFSPIYRHVLVVRQAVLQKEVDYLLEIGANAQHGYISTSMIEASRNRLSDRGFDPSLLSYTVTTTSGVSGTQPDRPVIRGEGIILDIRYPYEQLFAIDQLMGLSTPASDENMGAQGIKMSEYVPSNP